METKSARQRAEERWATAASGPPAPQAKPKSVDQRARELEQEAWRLHRQASELELEARAIRSLADYSKGCGCPAAKREGTAWCYEHSDRC